MKIIFLYPGFQNIHIILNYHRVLERNPNGLYNPSLIVTSNTFEMHIKEVKRLFNIVPLETVFQSKKSTGKFCTITFDDGWLDNYEIAFPVMKKYRVPATIFVPAAMIGGNQCFWYENLFNLADQSIKNHIEKRFIQYFHNLVPDWDPPVLNIDHLLCLTSALKLFPTNTLDQFVSDAYVILKIEPQENKTIIDWDQVSEMEQFGITFGSHGLYHYILPTIGNNLKRKEICGSLEILQSKSVKAVPFFSYPNGEWDQKSINFLSDAGYLGALTTQLGYNTSETHPLLMNRVHLHEYISHSPALFWFRIFQAFIARSKANY